VDAPRDHAGHELRTERLRLVPLDAGGMQLFVNEWPALQRRLGASPSSAWMTDRETLDAARRHHEAMLRDPDAWLWWTFWQVVLVSDGVSIGLVDFKGPPRPDGGVAVGCALAPPYRSRGYATEAVGALLSWALRQPAVGHVTASTDAANVRAHRLLEKLGFLRVEPGPAGPTRDAGPGGALGWRLAKPAGR
jgi:RimJ/RimL family protein N-acetyltransferase